MLASIEQRLHDSRSAAPSERAHVLRACAEELLALTSSGANAAGLGHLLRLLAMEIYSNGQDVDSATRPLAIAAEIARTSGDRAALRHCRSLQCLVLSCLQDYTGAIAAGREALQLSHELALGPQQTTAWTNMAVAFLDAGMSADGRFAAKQALHTLDSVAQADPGNENRATALQLLAESYWAEQALEEALRYARAAHELLCAGESSIAYPQYGWQKRALVAEFVARTLLFLGRSTEALAWLDQARLDAVRCGSARAVQCVEALQLAQQALAGRRSAITDLIALLDHIEPQPREDVLSTLVFIHEQLGEPDKALLFLRRRMQNAARKAFARHALSVDRTQPVGRSAAGNAGPKLCALARRLARRPHGEAGAGAQSRAETFGAYAV